MSDVDFMSDLENRIFDVARALAKCYVYDCATPAAMQEIDGRASVLAVSNVAVVDPVFVIQSYSAFKQFYLVQRALD